MNQLGHEIDIMKSYQIITNPSVTPISCALAQSAMEKNRTPVEEEKYEEYTVQSPLHQDVDGASTAWVILHRGIIGRPLSQYSGNLKPGIFVRLDNMTLAKRYCGFEQPMLFAELGRAFIVNTGIISSALSHTSASSQANFILSTSLVSSLS